MLGLRLVLARREAGEDRGDARFGRVGIARQHLPVPALGQQGIQVVIGEKLLVAMAWPAGSGSWIDDMKGTPSCARTNQQVAMQYTTGLRRRQDGRRVERLSA